MLNRYYAFEILAIVLIAFVFTSLGVLAQTPTDTTVSFGPLWEQLKPYLINLVGVLAAGLVTWLAALLKTKFNLDIDESMRATLHSAAETGAAKAIAMLDGPLADIKIDVKNPMVKTGADWVISTGAPAAVKYFNLSPEQVAELVQSKLGKFQVSRSLPAPAPAPTV